MEEWWLQTAAVVGMFVLRLGVPVAITVAVSYWLHRLDAKWKAEALARKADTVVAAKQEIGAFKPALATFKAIDQPCWLFNNCGEAAYSQCAAHDSPDLPCWMARLRAESRLPSGCPQCELFNAGSVLRQSQVVH